MGNGGGGERNTFNRREFLVAGVAATGLLATVGYAVPIKAQPVEPAPRTVLHRGKKITIQKRGGRQELSIEGRPVHTVYLNGAYRAMDFAYSPQPTLEGLGRRMVDYRAAPAEG